MVVGGVAAAVVLAQGSPGANAALSVLEPQTRHIALLAPEPEGSDAARERLYGLQDAVDEVRQGHVLLLYVSNPQWERRAIL